MLSYGHGKGGRQRFFIQRHDPAWIPRAGQPVLLEVIISVKHPVMAGHESDVKNVLRNPDEIRRSKIDSSVYLFYRTQQKGRWVCAVSKRKNGEGFLITAYPTDVIKTGEKVWPR